MKKLALIVASLSVLAVSGCGVFGGSDTLNGSVNPVVTLPPRSPTGEGLLGQVKECSPILITVNFRNLNDVPLIYDVNILNTFEDVYDYYVPYEFKTEIPPGDSEQSFYVKSASNYWSDAPNPDFLCGLINTLK
jgi:hypothetical protein